MEHNSNPGAFDSMNNLFPVSKTLSFRLVPIGNTLDTIRRNGVVEEAEQIKKDYEVLKVAADRVHKRFIEETLYKLHLKYMGEGDVDSIQEYAKAFESGDEDIMSKCADALKTSITKAFKIVKYDEKNTMLKALAGELLVKDILQKEPLSEKEAAALERMKRYTTFMRPYFTIRDHIYDAKEKGFTIPARVIDENLPIHLKNVKRFVLLPKDEREKLVPLFKAVSAKLDWAYELQDVFTVSAAACLSAQSAIDAYNTLIGGITLEDGTRIQGINEIVNLYNQSKTNEDGFRPLPKLEKLKKQILSDRESLSWLPEAFETDREVLGAIVKLDEEFREKIHYANLNFQEKTNQAKTDAVLINIAKLSEYSHACTGRWDEFERCIKEALKVQNPPDAREKENDYNGRINKLYSKMKSISVGELYNIVGKHSVSEQTPKYLDWYVHDKLVTPLVKAETDFKAMMDYIGSMGPDVKLGQTHRDEKENARTYIRTWLDDLMDARRAAEVFCTGDGTVTPDPAFYDTVVSPLCDFADTLVPLYNKIRNYLTRKPYSTNKIKLYFGTPTLLEGWDRNKEKDNRSILLQDAKNKYLAILPAHAKKLFEDKRAYDESSDMKRMSLKLIPGPFKTFPHVGFSAKGIPFYKPSQAVLDLYNSPKAVKDYSKNEVAIMVDYYKHLLATYPEWADMPFELKLTEEYGTLNEFFVDVERQAYCMSWKGVSRPFIERAVERGDLYLFKIDCMDMSENHHGIDSNPKAILDEAFSSRNAADTAIRILGKAAIYFRRASLPAHVTHPAGIPIRNKNPRSKNGTRTLPYDLIKDRRFTEDQFNLHIPFLLGPKNDKEGEYNVNSGVREIIKANPGMYVLGINRGERNLVSIAVTAPDGRIVEQRHLNVFDNFDYREKLASVEKERLEARRDWNAITGIKNIKAGYLSRVIGEIVQLVKKYNCVVALENLDMEFKRGRQQFEKNIYQQFECDLVNRLSLLMDKHNEDRTKNTLQLAAPGKTPEERTRYPQNGIVFFMNPSWITKTDPLTGFVNRLNTYYTSGKKTQELLDRFDSFRYLPEEKMFALTFRYSNVSPGKETGADHPWTVYTHGKRNKENRESRTFDIVDVTMEMENAFISENIEYKDGAELLPRIKGCSAVFYKAFLEALRLTLQNTMYDGKELRIVSCTKDASGGFYEGGEKYAAKGLPADADINAAWNIARKCHMVLRNIREFVPGVTLDIEGKIARGPRMIVTDEDWLREVQK